MNMKRKKILLVEDDELDVISFQRSLKEFEEHYELITAFNGKEALAKLTGTGINLDPDLIILDLNMPKMSGVEFLKELRKHERLKKIKVFVMTTSSEIIDRSVTEQLGISGYFIKPLNYKDNAKKTDSMDSFVQFHLRKILND